MIVFFQRRRIRREQAIIAALQRNTELTGHDLARVAHLSSGVFYGTVMRMEQEGRIASRWGQAPPGREHRPRLYRLPATPGGEP